MKLESVIITFILLWGNSLIGQPLEPIPSGMTYNLVATVNETGSQGFGIKIQTKEPYDCEMPEIIHKTTIKGNRISVIVKGVKISNDCQGRLNPASTIIDLHELGPGEYSFKPVVHKQILKSTLIITKTGYSFKTNENPTLFLIQNSSLNKIPEGTIWGTCNYKKINRTFASKFLMELQNAGAKRVSLPLGNYGEFYVHTKDKFTEISDGANTTTYFTYRFHGDFGVIREIASQYVGYVEIDLHDLGGNHL